MCINLLVVHIADVFQVAEQLINPFGDDDEDFELNWIIDRHMKVIYSCHGRNLYHKTISVTCTLFDVLLISVMGMLLGVFLGRGRSKYATSSPC